MQKLAPINFKRWIDEHRHLLKPPVGNQQVWADREFMVTVVGGPNSRTDYHLNQGEEFFYQLEGDIVLKTVQRDDDGTEVMVDVPIAEGDIFLLPPNVPHSPQRPAGTIGLVLERQRRPGELDGFRWYCPGCNAKLYEEFAHVTNLVTQLPPIFQRFYDNPNHSTCRQCGVRVTKA
jgi:3-hydroxyanthranilate 3,4-dioxygenase